MEITWQLIIYIIYLCSLMFLLNDGQSDTPFFTDEFLCNNKVVDWILWGYFKFGYIGIPLGLYFIVNFNK